MDSSELLDLVKETKKQLLHLQALGVEGVQLSKAPASISKPVADSAVSIFQSRSANPPLAEKPVGVSINTLFGDLAPQPEKLAASQETFEEIHNEIGDCTRCPLHRER